MKYLYHILVSHIHTYPHDFYLYHGSQGLVLLQKPPTSPGGRSPLFSTNPRSARQKPSNCTAAERDLGSAGVPTGITGEADSMGRATSWMIRQFEWGQIWEVTKNGFRTMGQQNHVETTRMEDGGKTNRKTSRAEPP